MVLFKDKAPNVPFDRITSQYSYFKEIWTFAPIEQGTKKTKKACFALDQLYIWTESEKFVYNNQQCFALQVQMFDSHLLYCEFDSLKPS